MDALSLSRIADVAPDERPVELVERKGKGHPDTLCDALVEEVSLALLRHYEAHFGAPQHYNVDKALLWAGASEPAFGGGRVIRPMRIFLAGRATMEMDGIGIPVAELALECAREWLDANLHALDSALHVEIEPLFRPGSAHLRDIFRRRPQRGAALANDTSAKERVASIALEAAGRVTARRPHREDLRIDGPARGRGPGGGGSRKGA